MFLNISRATGRPAGRAVRAVPAGRAIRAVAQIEQCSGCTSIQLLTHPTKESNCDFLGNTSPTTTMRWKLREATFPLASVLACVCTIVCLISLVYSIPCYCYRSGCMLTAMDPPSTTLFERFSIHEKLDDGRRLCNRNKLTTQLTLSQCLFVYIYIHMYILLYSDK